jgi:hypothetical protein
MKTILYTALSIGTPIGSSILIWLALNALTGLARL